MGKLVPGNQDSCVGACSSNIPAAEEEEGGCGSSQEKSMGGDMAAVDAQLGQEEAAVDNNLEVEITTKSINGNAKPKGHNSGMAPPTNGVKKPKVYTPKKVSKQVMGQCKKCGYLSSQDICKACVLLEGLNKARPKNHIEVGYEVQDISMNSIREEMTKTTLAGE